MMIEGRTPESITKLKEILSQADRNEHPWLAKPKLTDKDGFIPFKRGQKVEPPAWYKSDEENWANIQQSGIMTSIVTSPQRK